MISDKHLNDQLLFVENLKVYFPIKQNTFDKTKKFIKAVDGINISVKEGEAVGIVGESGCGKSTTARGILRLVEPYDGSVYFKGKDLLKLQKKEIREIRKNMQMIFQDPYASLNSRRTIGSIIGEPFSVHKIASGQDKINRVVDLMKEVGLRPEYINRFPHEFSGGQRQRIGIARALALRPKLIICDEPVSALDVSIQAQILNLLQELQEKYKLTYLFISHDLAVVKHICNKIVVMYLGKIVESANADELFDNPMHPYTRALLESIPIPDPEVKKEMEMIEGDIPNALNPPDGCRFHVRCPYAKEICRVEEPMMKEILPNHFCSCHVTEEENK